MGGVTMTTEVVKTMQTTLSRMNFSGYAGHVTVFQIKSNQFICQHNTEKQDLI